MGTVTGWAPTFAPKGWAYCLGQTIAISQNSALFALLGTTYGGNGTTTFLLPNLGGRLPVGAGQSGGTSQYRLGEIGGTETVTLLQSQMPMHTHNGIGLTVEIGASTSAANSSAPGPGQVLAAANGTSDGGEAVTVNAYASSSGQNTTLHGGAVAGNVTPAGGNTPFSVLQPFLAISFIICIQGIFPPRQD